MGGYGTYKFSTSSRPVRARAADRRRRARNLGAARGTDGPLLANRLSSLTERQLESVRNIPFLIWDEKTDELVPITGVKEQVKRFDELGYRYEFDEFQAGEHLTPAINDEYKPAPNSSGPERSTATPRTSPTRTTRR